MKAYKGTFIKKNGERRTMRYLKMSDVPKKLLEGKFKAVQKHTLAEGSELVWDIDEQDFRVFNHKLLVDKIEEFEYTLH